MRTYFLALAILHEEASADRTHRRRRFARLRTARILDLWSRLKRFLLPLQRLLQVLWAHYEGAPCGDLLEVSVRLPSAR